MDVLDDIERDSANQDYRPWDMDINSYCMLMHMSQFAGFVVPFAGLAMPIIMWSTQKEKSSVIDEHGKNILNFMISYIIYSIACAILCLLVIGFIGLIGLAIGSLVFVVIASIKANKGEVYEYPLTISFFK